MTMRFRILCVACALVLAGCSSLPSEIRNPPRDGAEFHDAVRDPDAYQGRPVRWGGEIIGVENRDSVTWIEVLQRPLDVDGRPEDTDQTRGRYIARVEGFLDPAVYAKGRKLTTYGIIERGAEGSIGNQTYIYPMVNSERTYLWDMAD